MEGIRDLNPEPERTLLDNDLVYLTKGLNSDFGSILAGKHDPVRSIARA